MNRQSSSFMRFDNENPEGSSPMQKQHPFSVKEVLKKLYKKMIELETWSWRKIVLFVCVFALGVDPLFLFVPEIDAKRFCFTFHTTLAAVVSFTRTVIDTLYVLLIIFHHNRSKRTPKDESTVHSEDIRKFCLFFYLIVDILSVIPIPQVVVLSCMQGSDALVTRRVIKWIILAQYVPRVVRIYPHYKDVSRTSGRVADSKWIGASFNFFLYILHSYVFGAFWYVSAIEKINKCWRHVCHKTDGCVLEDLYCEGNKNDNSRFLNTSCQLINPDDITDSKVFNFGMYIDVLKSGMVNKEPRDFPRKFFYCFWWGLRNISAFGQNLKTSNSVGDVIFAIIICVCGLLLFAVFIGNVQKYLISATRREEEILRQKRKQKKREDEIKDKKKAIEKKQKKDEDEMEEKKRAIEKWMSYRRLPVDLKEEIMSHVKNEGRETRGVDEESLLLSLPKHLSLKTKRHLYKEVLNRAPLKSLAAYTIQEAWRNHCKRKHDKIIRAERDKQQRTKLKLGATLAASRFVSKTLRNRRENTADCSSPTHM